MNRRELFANAIKAGAAVAVAPVAAPAVLAEMKQPEVPDIYKGLRVRKPVKYHFAHTSSMEPIEWPRPAWGWTSRG